MWNRSISQSKANFFFCDRSAKYGEEGAKVIRETVNENLKDYEYLKSFTVKASS